jgi:hypothetical protein
MSATLLYLTVSGIGLFSGALGGAAVVRFTRHRQRDVSKPKQTAGDELDIFINEQARDWAERTGRPEAAELIARKLRLAHAISTRRHETRRVRNRRQSW